MTGYVFNCNESVISENTLSFGNTPLSGHAMFYFVWFNVGREVEHSARGVVVNVAAIQVNLDHR